MANGTAGGETELFRPVGDDVVLMHGQVWRVREKGLVRIAEVTEPSGEPLGSTNWRRAYIGACGSASFADDAMGGELSVVQVRCLVYPEGDGLRATRDMLRTSSGILVEGNGSYTLVTKRTRYVFARLDDAEASAVEAAMAAM